MGIGAEAALGVGSTASFATFGHGPRAAEAAPIVGALASFVAHSEALVAAWIGCGGWLEPFDGFIGF